jgi:uncharacterized membrane protein YgcG
MSSLRNTVVSPGTAGVPGKAMGEQELMGRIAGLRRVSDTGSTTGVATAILALISAGTVASITLVGVHQLAPAVSRLRSAHEPSSVRAPREVVVTPRSSPSPSSIGGSQGHTSKPRAGSPPDFAVVQVAAPTIQHGVTHVVPAVGLIQPPAVTPRSVDPTRPAPPTQTLNPSENPSVGVPTGHAHPSRVHRSRPVHGRETDEQTRRDRSARSHRGSSGRGQHGGRNHHGGEGDDHGRRSNGHGGHGGTGGSQRDRHGH